MPLHRSIDSKDKNPYFPFCSSNCYTERQAKDKRDREEHEARWHREQAKKKEERQQEADQRNAEHLAKLRVWERSPEGQKRLAEQAQWERSPEGQKRLAEQGLKPAHAGGCAGQATAWISFCVLLYFGLILFNNGKVAQAAIFMTAYVPIYFGLSLFKNDK